VESLYQKLHKENAPKYAERTSTSSTDLRVPMTTDRKVKTMIAPNTNGIHLSSLKSSGNNSFIPM
jgi:hypothetical protein